MKKLKLFFVTVITLGFILLPIHSAHASVQDFEIEDFTADYYLIKMDDGTSKLHVEETITAIFPEIDQNRGITRAIPLHNQNRKNRVIANTEALNLTVTRNGEAEPSKIKEDGEWYYTVYIGDANSYVHGKQVYHLEYDFTDVITEFTEIGVNVSGVEWTSKAYQELYWDTNGTDWRQRFSRVTANLHLEDSALKNLISDKTSCYVGKYGDKGEDRCTITEIDDGISFTTENLIAGENLTFVVDFKPNTFAVILEKNYILMIILLLEILVAIWAILSRFKKYRKNAAKQVKLYKSLFVTPQYQPPIKQNVYVAEGEQLYIKQTEPSYVATLLELAVNKDISIKKVTGEKYEWAIRLNTEPSLLATTSQRTVLDILAGGSGNLSTKHDIPIEKHEATSELALSAKLYYTTATQRLEKQELFYDTTKTISASKASSLFYNVAIILASIMVFFFLMRIFKSEGFVNVMSGYDYNVVVGSDFFVPCSVLIMTLMTVISSTLTRKTKVFSKYTDDGVRMVNYLDGLEMYIKMAEADRIKFLQSVDGVDVSNEGIVKLHEKLLPWASLFGLEKSWAKELKKYYQMSEIQETADTSNLLSGALASSFSDDISRAIRSSTNYHESSSGWSGGSSYDSGGSSSSSDSGGGGGGFSGGGGGGGGGGGW